MDFVSFVLYHCSAGHGSTTGLCSSLCFDFMYGNVCSSAVYLAMHQSVGTVDQQVCYNVQVTHGCGRGL